METSNLLRQMALLRLANLLCRIIVHVETNGSANDLSALSLQEASVIELRRVRRAIDAIRASDLF